MEVRRDSRVPGSGGAARGGGRLPDADGARRPALGARGGRGRVGDLRRARQPACLGLWAHARSLHRGLLRGEPARRLPGVRRAPEHLAVARWLPHRGRRRRDPSRPLLAASRLASTNTAFSIGRVSLPVKVFCWLGWKLPRRITPSGMAACAVWPNRGSGRGTACPVARRARRYASQPILPSATTTRTSVSRPSSSSKYGWHRSISTGKGLLAGGAQRKVAVM